MIRKSIYYMLVFLGLILGMACIKVETHLEEKLDKPTFLINIKILDSGKWKRAYLATSSVDFAELTDDHNVVGSGTLQNWHGTLLDIDLSLQRDKVLLEKPYWESTLLGIDPKFLGSAFVTEENVFVDNVNIDYLEYIPFRSQTDIRNGRRYEIDSILDLDEIIEQSDSTVVLNTSKILATMFEL